MRPSLTTNDPMTLLTADAVDCSKLNKGDSSLRVSFADSLYVLWAKFSHAVRLAFFARKAVPGMNYVKSMRSPFKIANMVISWIVVKMIHNVSIWSWANKSSSNKPMNKRSCFTSIPAKLNDAMPILSFCWGENFVGPDAKDISKIGNLVKRLKSLDGDKDFVHIQPLLVGSSVVVAWQLAQKPAFGSYPSQAGEF